MKHWFNEATFWNNGESGIKGFLSSNGVFLLLLSIIFPSALYLAVPWEKEVKTPIVQQAQPVIQETPQPVKKVAKHSPIVEAIENMSPLLAIERIVAHEAVKKINEVIPQLDIDSTLSAHGWGIDIKDSRKGEYNINMRLDEDGYHTRVVDSKDGISINIRE